MKTQLKINGEMRDVEIENGNITIIEPEKKRKKKRKKKRTGWEREKYGEKYVYNNFLGKTLGSREDAIIHDDIRYEMANYYNSQELAENINRMQTLVRKMFRWQAENDVVLQFKDIYTAKWHIFYDIQRDKIIVGDWYTMYHSIFSPFFFSKEKAEECIEVFKDDLKWLFTEFKWRMD